MGKITMKNLILAGLLMVSSQSIIADNSPSIYASDGTYRGRLGTKPWL